MSFTKTISVFAALASIFGAGAAGWKLAQDREIKPPEYEQKIEELQRELLTLRKETTDVNPPEAPTLPEPQVNVSQVPKPITLPPSLVTLVPPQSPSLASPSPPTPTEVQ